MNEPQINQEVPEVTPTVPKPNIVDIPAEKITQLNIDDIKPNSILVINVNIGSPEEKMALAPVFARLLSPFTITLREKRVSVMLMTLNENLTLVSEEDMNAAGWFKKDKPLIINPYETK